MFKTLLFSLIAFAVFGAHAESPKYPQQSRNLVKGKRPFKIFQDGDVRKVRVAFFDADSTFRVAKSNNVSANGPLDTQALPCVGAQIENLVDQGYLIAVVSNQGGIGDGRIAATYEESVEVAESALREAMRQIVEERNPRAQFHHFDYDEDKFFKRIPEIPKAFWPEDKWMRKPGPGMAYRLMESVNKKWDPDGENPIQLDFKYSFMVGDSLFKKKKERGGVVLYPGDQIPNGKTPIHFSNSDRGFAMKMHKAFKYAGEEYKNGIPFFDPADFFGWLEPTFSTENQPIALYNKYSLAERPQYTEWTREVFKVGGDVETEACKDLTPFKKYAQYIAEETSPWEWMPNYMCKSDDQQSDCLPLSERPKKFPNP